jgi:hypothetical protein
MAQWSDGFQAHVAGALDGPFIVLFQEQCADQANDGGFIRPSFLRSRSATS